MVDITTTTKRLHRSCRRQQWRMAMFQLLRPTIAISWLPMLLITLFSLAATSSAATLITPITVIIVILMEIVCLICRHSICHRYRNDQSQTRATISAATAAATVLVVIRPSLQIAAATIAQSNQRQRRRRRRQVIHKLQVSRWVGHRSRVAAVAMRRRPPIDLENVSFRQLPPPAPAPPPQPLTRQRRRRQALLLRPQRMQQQQAVPHNKASLTMPQWEKFTVTYKRNNKKKYVRIQSFILFIYLFVQPGIDDEQ